MFNLLQTANDDQTAIGACILTLAGAAFFVFASFHLGPAGQKLRSREQKKIDLNLHPQAELHTVHSQERAA